MCVKKLTKCQVLAKGRVETELVGPDSVAHNCIIQLFGTRLLGFLGKEDSANSSAA
jgi:hypothetical protein